MRFESPNSKVLSKPYSMYVVSEVVHNLSLNSFGLRTLSVSLILSYTWDSTQCAPCFKKHEQVGEMVMSADSGTRLLGFEVTVYWPGGHVSLLGLHNTVPQTGWLTHKCIVSSSGS